MSSRSNPADPFPSQGTDPLDRLLLRAPLLEPDTWFAARTVARCRNSERARSIFAWNRFWPRWAVGGVLGLFLGALTLQKIHHSEKVSFNKQRHVQEAFEVLATLDNDPDGIAPPQDSTF
jgi:hypothetical protein